MKLAYLLMGVALLLSSCSEDIFPGGSESNEDVTISLAYSDVSPRDIVVNSRATPEEERHLDNLYIYIFDGNGNLKGYKGIEGEAKLDQSTSSTYKAEITDIKTRSGESYIYAVANISSTGLYPVETSDNTVEENKLPINLDEDKARAGEYNFTLNKLKALTFNRENTSIDVSTFLMSGAVQTGNLVNITTAGTIASGDNTIRLSRIVSKVKFTIKAAKEEGITRSFKLDTYDIMNIAQEGRLIGNNDGNDRIEAEKVNNNIGNTIGVNDVEDGAQFFEVYLPENLQTKVKSANSQAAREDDSQTKPQKVFTNAPAKGTYVVLKGKYEETKNGTTRSADVTYYVHLGDCTNDVDNYDVERNCKYTYNITVAGVDKIIVEALKQDEEYQPGAEGVVLEYGAKGKNMTLDSHYEYMVMRFYQNDIQELQSADKDYYYQVYALGNHTDVINVGAKTDGKVNGVDTSWIQFAIKCSRDGTSSIYSPDRTNRGTACSYPGTEYSRDLYTVEDFLKYLYDNANSTSIWTGKDSKGRNYIDATCFISENYYKNLKWNQYVNDVDKRAFYVANEVETSKDGRSAYAKTQYGLTQYNIQTFYDRSKAESITAYGCETINDEEGKIFSVNGGGWKYNSAGTDTWNGRANMLKDIEKSDDWESLKSNESLIKACMSRNRDLNGDGKISNDEIRWYAPTISQYIGIWIGEEIMSTEAKLFNRSTSTLKGESDRMLYYSSTNNQNTYFSEEGMATNNYYYYDSKHQNLAYPPKLVRCLRNLQSYNEGYNSEPAQYYTYNPSESTVTLDKVDEKALNTSGELEELNEHEERSAGNKPAKSFRIAAKTYPENNSGNASMENVVDGRFKCYGKYNEEGDRKWRVPNQREMSVMYLIDPSLIYYTYCRTKFSNTNFRKSWTYTDVFTMATNWSDYSSGKVRCIKVLK